MFLILVLVAFAEDRTCTPDGGSQAATTQPGEYHLLIPVQSAEKSTTERALDVRKRLVEQGRVTEGLLRCSTSVVTFTASNVCSADNQTTICLGLNGDVTVESQTGGAVPSKAGGNTELNTLARQLDMCPSTVH